MLSEKNILVGWPARMDMAWGGKKAVSIRRPKCCLPSSKTSLRVRDSLKSSAFRIPNEFVPPSFCFVWDNVFYFVWNQDANFGIEEGQHTTISCPKSNDIISNSENATGSSKDK